MYKTHIILYYLEFKKTKTNCNPRFHPVSIIIASSKKYCVREICVGVCVCVLLLRVYCLHYIHCCGNRCTRIYMCASIGYSRKSVTRLCSYRSTRVIMPCRGCRSGTQVCENKQIISAVPLPVTRFWPPLPRII